MKIAPSILSADYACLGEEFRRMEQSGADMLHIDVMDGHFVPNLTFGAPVIQKLRRSSSLPFDVHLMISEPLRYVEDFANAGADILTFHLESDSDPEETIAAIRSCHVVPAISIKPNTPANAVLPYLDQVGMVLVMTVEPGFGGQAFMADMMPKVAEIRREITQRNLKTELQVDGGITPETIRKAASAGADVFVAGNTVFGAKDAAEMIHLLRETAKQSAGK